MRPSTRIIAGIIAVAVAVTLIARLNLTATERDISFVQAAWVDYRFFTLWTNTLIGVVCGLIAFGRSVPHWLTGGSVLAMAIVAGVYHALLAAGRELVGLDYAIDLMVHTIIPAGFIAFWMFVLPKDQLKWRDLWIWAGYPVFYCIYAVARGAIDGVYPYFFLDVADLGGLGVAAWVAGLAAVFLVLGAAVMAIARKVAVRA